MIFCATEKVKCLAGIKTTSSEEYTGDNAWLEYNYRGENVSGDTEKEDEMT